MGFVELELPCRKNSPLVASADPDPHWTLDALLSELNSIETQLGARFSAAPSPLKQPEREFCQKKALDRSNNKPFVMCVTDDDVGDSESDDEEKDDQSLVPATRFTCNDLCLSEFEESDDELLNEDFQPCLIEKRHVEEGVLFELESEHQLNVKEQVRNKIAALEVYHNNEIERIASVMARLEKFAEVRREMDGKLDKHYQRKIAEVVDKHLSAVQRDHEQRSQIVERRIRDDAALEEAKRKEKAFHEEKLQQERAKQEAEQAREKSAKLAEEARMAALEAAAKEASEKEAARLREKAISEVDQRGALALSKLSSVEERGEIKHHNLLTNEFHSDKQKGGKLSGIKVFAANAALDAEKKRLTLSNEVPDKAHLTKDFGKIERQIAKSISKLLPTVDNVITRAQELINYINAPECPRPISYCLFASKVVSLCRDRNTKDKTFEKTTFACGYVILRITSQIPAAMDFLLAEFHKVCIYTVPKYLHPLDQASQRKDYFTMIGYHEVDGKLESDEAYLTSIAAYMKLYAAMIQTEINGIKNPHGLKEGWKWLAMFLNHLPANTSTAYALEAFLKMAGFALYKRYGCQFLKILNVISRSFLPALKKQGTKVRADPIKNLEHYLDNKVYLQEPEGRRLATSLLSRELAL
ncbi:protein GLE1 isoform X1 [Ananas comosus]|uniref:mRNA export factor GLE1 n=1 Tax=Ananas comosus TaxID=4615 RepID=A0A6P5H0S7_ANACO|nr:protein GLE1 isoform X1 [Ananas comosus]XP_020111646.1 protein GLE1 isoform X1 [Ananas comosus]XP_020111647.1 protein GLE1 isoform X1 [Ananas comosus]